MFSSVASWPAYRPLRRQVRWSDIPICLRIFHSLLWSTHEGFSIVSEADVFLEFPCFFYDPADVGNLIAGSSAFPKSSLNIWKFLVHVLLKPSLQDFEHCLAGMWNECNCAVVWVFSLMLTPFLTSNKSLRLKLSLTVTQYLISTLTLSPIVRLLFHSWHTLYVCVCVCVCVCVWCAHSFYKQILAWNKELLVHPVWDCPHCHRLLKNASLKIWVMWG